MPTRTLPNFPDPGLNAPRDEISRAGKPLTSIWNIGKYKEIYRIYGAYREIYGNIGRYIRIYRDM